MSEWGPLEALIGEWEGEGGLDRAYSHAKAEVLDTPYTEKVTMKPFGPVDNGRQRLYGLDYRSAMWRGDEQDPFHTEVGYWLWDVAAGEVLRGFVVPRGITVLAGGTGIAADATSYRLTAKLGDPRYGIAENTYLGTNASSTAYEVDITVNDDGTWSYAEHTWLAMREFDEIFDHSDSNTLHKVG
jgi:hypothetical protein